MTNLSDEIDELVVSPTAQELTLYHRSSLHRPYYNNTVTASIGVIVVNTYTMGLKYKPAIGLTYQNLIDSTQELFRHM